MGYYIHLVDDHRLFRQGLRILLEEQPEISLVRESESGQAFLDDLDALLAAGPRPDLVLMDISMPGKDGVATTAELARRAPGVKVMALSMFGDQEYYYQMIEAGARGFLLKNTDFDEVKRAILTVVAGGNHFSEGLLYSLIRNIKERKAEPEPADDLLSARETDILLHICMGMSNQEIGDKLAISKRTVDKHRSNILFKTGCKNTASLVIYAIKHRLIEI